MGGENGVYSDLYSEAVNSSWVAIVIALRCTLKPPEPKMFKNL